VGQRMVEDKVTDKAWAGSNKWTRDSLSTKWSAHALCIMHRGNLQIYARTDVSVEVF